MDLTSFIFPIPPSIQTMPSFSGESSGGTNRRTQLQAPRGLKKTGWESGSGCMRIQNNNWTRSPHFPSGYFSDRFGDRKALHIAAIFGITGWASYTFASSFTGVLIAEIQLGISYAFISGADSALLFETLRQEGREADYARHDGRMTAWAQAGEAGGAIGAGVLYAWFPLLPFLPSAGGHSLRSRPAPGAPPAPQVDRRQPPLSPPGRASRFWPVQRVSAVFLPASFPLPAVAELPSPVQRVLPAAPPERCGAGSRAFAKVPSAAPRSPPRQP